MKAKSHSLMVFAASFAVLAASGCVTDPNATEVSSLGDSSNPPGSQACYAINTQCSDVTRQYRTCSFSNLDPANTPACIALQDQISGLLAQLNNPTCRTALSNLFCGDIRPLTDNFVRNDRKYYAAGSGPFCSFVDDAAFARAGNRPEDAGPNFVNFPFPAESPYVSIQNFLGAKYDGDCFVPDGPMDWLSAGNIVYHTEGYTGSKDIAICRYADEASYLASGGFALYKKILPFHLDFPVYFRTTNICSGGVHAAAPVLSSMVNISTRGGVDGGQKVLIGGFIVSGTDPKHIAVRGIGPSLARAGVANALANPSIEVHGANGGVIATNDDWQSDAQAGALSSLGLAPSDAREAALLLTLPPGSYTVIVSGAAGGSGEALFEAYDVGHDTGSLLANLSTRFEVNGGGQPSIGGFIIRGGVKRIAIHALGPSLARAGVTSPLADPRFEVHTTDIKGRDVTIARSDDPANQYGPVLQYYGAPLPDSHDAGVLLQLQPGSYTVVIKGISGDSGTALFALYDVGINF